MTRIITIGAAQLGPIARTETRSAVVARMIALMDRAAARGVQMLVYPELALTTFFPRWYFEDQADIDAFFETEMPGPETQPLFDRARELGIAFSFGYAEKTVTDGQTRRFNSSILVSPEGEIVAKYHKIHLPGHFENEPWRPFQHLEKRYFEPGEAPFAATDMLGGKWAMAICNDRRWPETYRECALRGAEVLTLGYNTPMHYAPAPEHDHLQAFHNHLSMQAGAYANGMWVVGVAKAGREEGCDLLGQSCIIAPTGEIVAMASTTGDELVTADCDLDRTLEIRANIFNFALHRRPAMYPMLAAQD